MQLLKEYKKQWYLKNKEKISKKTKEYRDKNRNLINYKRKEKRHQLGISVKYNTGKRIPKKIYNQRYKALKKAGGELTIKRIQMVYEDNIKKYGTLTCYLCLNPILFGRDELEHKTPLSRGGTNEYSNLAITCKKCNNKKFNKTVEEYKKVTNGI